MLPREAAFEKINTSVLRGTFKGCGQTTIDVHYLTEHTLLLPNTSSPVNDNTVNEWQSGKELQLAAALTTPGQMALTPLAAINTVKGCFDHNDQKCPIIYLVTFHIS